MIVLTDALAVSSIFFCQVSYLSLFLYSISLYSRFLTSKSSIFRSTHNMQLELTSSRCKRYYLLSSSFFTLSRRLGHLQLHCRRVRKEDIRRLLASLPAWMIFVIRVFLQIFASRMKAVQFPYTTVDTLCWNARGRFQILTHFVHVTDNESRMIILLITCNPCAVRPKSFENLALEYLNLNEFFF